MINLNYLIDHIQIFKIILSFIKKHETLDYNSPKNICLNKTESGIAFKIETEYYLDLLTLGRMKLLRSTKNKITKDENHLEIAEAVLVHCNIINNNYQRDPRVLYTLIPNKPFGQLLDVSSTNFIFSKT